MRDNKANGVATVRGGGIVCLCEVLCRYRHARLHVTILAAVVGFWRSSGRWCSVLVEEQWGGWSREEQQQQQEEQEQEQEEEQEQEQEQNTKSENDF